MLKNLAANVGDVRDLSLVPGLGRSLGEGNGNPVQYSCLENPMDIGAWWSTVYGVAKSRTQLSTEHTHTSVLQLVSCTADQKTAFLFLRMMRFCRSRPNGLSDRTCKASETCSISGLNLNLDKIMTILC